MSKNSQNHLQDLNVWDKKTAQNYDTPDIGMFSEKVITPTVQFLKNLANNGNVLEFAVGTGRIAIPLSNSGVCVYGIDYSQAMVDELYKKTSSDILPVVVGDMTTTKINEEFSLVYLVFNSISNLLTQEAQIECFKNAASHLTKGGKFVIELWVPELRKLPPGQSAVVFATEEKYVGLDTYDLDNQIVTSNHFHLNSDYGKANVFKTKHRYIWPAELDLMAMIAGFNLENRFSDWNSSPFNFECRSHVSVYTLA